METLKTDFLCDLSADLEVPQDIEITPRGTRRIIYVKGGTFQGPRLKGEVLPGGGDWLLVRPDGTSELDVRSTLRTDDGISSTSTIGAFSMRRLTSCNECGRASATSTPRDITFARRQCSRRPRRSTVGSTGLLRSASADERRPEWPIRCTRSYSRSDEGQKGRRST